VRGLTALDTVAVWETAYRLHPIDRVLSLLLQVMADHSRETLAALPLSERDSLVLALRRATFGDALPGKSNCPRCDETVEFTLRCSELAPQAKPQLKQVERDGYRATIRPLNSFDLAASANAATLREARDLLLERCVAGVSYNDESIEAKRLPEEIQHAISEIVAETDPQAEILINLNCPECRHQWQILLDIGHFFWLEINSRAQHLLMEVHLLAKAYGWTEEEILKLSSCRRSAYLQMVMA